MACVIKGEIDPFRCPLSKHGMTRSVSTQKLFHTMAVHSKPTIKKNSISS